MKQHLLAALGGAVMLATGLAAPASANYHGHSGGVTTVQITISCFRGPTDEIIWDRPNAVFIDSLVAAGYTFPEAHAIGERVCRDNATVNNPNAAIAVMNRIMAENPPGR